MASNFYNQLHIRRGCFPMKDRIAGVKAWYKEHKEGIKGEAIQLCWYAVGIGVGYFVGTKLNSLRIGSGLMRLHDDGVMKFFDPLSEKEIDISELGKVVKKMYK